MKPAAIAAVVGLAAAVTGFVISQAGSERLEPDHRLTPGDTLSVSAADVCTPGYAKKVRNVPQAVKDKVFKEYGITKHNPGDWEIDHSIPLELGGSNSILNLWPQSYKTKPWGAHEKDALENELHHEVCAGKISLSVAQAEISSDWIACYKKHFRRELP